MNTTIQQVYDSYGIPVPLRLHMLRVAAVAAQILDGWFGPPVNRQSLLRVLLLHDMGNLVKMDLTSSHNKILQSVMVDRSLQIQAELVGAYGPDDHKASRHIGSELGLTPVELDLMDRKLFVQNEETLACLDFAVKIGAYADQRVAPNGVLPILDRLLEAKERYKDRPGSSMHNPKTDLLINCAREIERQVLAYSKWTAAEINDASIKPYMDQLCNVPITYD